MEQYCPHRAPKKGNFEQAVRTAQTQERLHRSPFLAMELLSQKHPEAFLGYVQKHHYCCESALLLETAI